MARPIEPVIGVIHAVAALAQNGAGVFLTDFLRRLYHILGSFMVLSYKTSASQIFAIIFRLSPTPALPSL